MQLTGLVGDEAGTTGHSPCDSPGLLLEQLVAVEGLHSISSQVGRAILTPSSRQLVALQAPYIMESNVLMFPFGSSQKKGNLHILLDKLFECT